MERRKQSKGARTKDHCQGHDNDDNSGREEKFSTFQCRGGLSLSGRGLTSPAIASRSGNKWTGIFEASVLYWRTNLR